MKKFNTKKEACEYYGQTWEWIEKNMKVKRFYTNSGGFKGGGGFRGYFINK